VAEHRRYADEPANLFVATFIGSPQMNVLSACLTFDGDAARVEGRGFSFVFARRPSYAEGEVSIVIARVPEERAPALGEKAAFPWSRRRFTCSTPRGLRLTSKIASRGRRRSGTKAAISW
jgi:hypothetical protein